MDIRIIILAIPIVLNLSLGLFVYYQNKKNRINVYYGVFCIFTAIWPSTLLFFMSTNSPEYALWWMKASYVAAAGIASSLFYFSLTLPSGKKIKKIYSILIVVSFVFISALLLIPNFLTKKVVEHSWGKEVLLGSLEHAIFTIFFVAVYYSALIVILKKRKKCKGAVRARLLYIFFGVLIPSIFGGFFNLVLASPWLQNFKYIWLGPIFTMIMVMFIAYAIVKHHLFNAKVIATELLTFFIFMVILIDTLTFETIPELLFNASLLAIITIAGIFLIRSVIKEVKMREKVEKLVRELREVNEHLTEIDQAKTEFVSVASHQLRTPLSVIKSILSMMVSGDFGKIDDAQKMYLEKAFKHSERLDKLIEILLNVTRIEQGRIELKLEKTEMEKFAEGILDDYKEISAEKKIKLYYKKNKDQLPKAILDQDQIKEVLTNLIDNAIKYTMKGEIMVSTKSDGENIIVNVKDTGIGFNEGESDEIFQRFSRSKRSKQIYSKGAGLGLYVARKIVEAHKGHIWAESEGEGKGSTFSFSLPLN